jgi:L-ascorbate metabolism protein UlaG (beta-lactamase superfamily)
MDKSSRRKWLAGTGAMVALAGVEWWSLRGNFDNWRAVGETHPHADYQQQKANLDRIDKNYRGLLHFGHSTHLLAMGGWQWLTDPWFYDPAFGALSHRVGPVVPAHEVGKLNVILISHDHPDHADPKALDRLDKRAKVLVSTKELAAKIKAMGFQEVFVLQPWEHMALGDCKVSAVPAEHDTYEIGYVIEHGTSKMYFAGDTRLHPAMNEIGERFQPEIAILPVDGTRVRGEALYVMTPQDATKAAKILGSRWVIPSHAEAEFSDPLVKHVMATTVENAASVFCTQVKAQLPGVKTTVPRVGELISFSLSC